MLAIRLSRTGSKKQAHYRVVVCETKQATEGRFVEIVGHYNPRTVPATVHREPGADRPLAQGGRAAVGDGPHAAGQPRDSRTRGGGAAGGRASEPGAGRRRGRRPGAGRRARRGARSPRPSTAAWPSIELFVAPGDLGRVIGPHGPHGLGAADAGRRHGGLPRFRRDARNPRAGVGADDRRRVERLCAGRARGADPRQPRPGDRQPGDRLRRGAVPGGRRAAGEPRRPHRPRCA